jgi:hypothetical protein
MAAVPLPSTTATRATSPWLYGAVPDLLLGAGLAYAVSIPLLAWWGSARGASAWPPDVAIALALAFSAPHYGATLVRVYEQRADRRRYALFAVHFTVAMVLVSALALRSPWLTSLLITIYVTWSPWHFAGQNYGISLMFMRRRGVAIPAGAKRLIYASFVLSAVLAVLAIHSAGSRIVFAAGAEDTSRTGTLMRLGVPADLTAVLGAALAVAWLAALGAAAWTLLRAGAAVRDLGSAAAVTATQSLWFTVPALGVATGVWSAQHLAFAPIWISTAHAIQYLWVTCFYAGRASSPSRVGPFLVKAMLAGAALNLGPRLLFVPGLLGAHLPTTASVSILLFAVLNIHHFVLDGAIWKLRDGRVARALLRSEPAATEPSQPAPARGLLRPLVWVLGLGCLLYMPWAFYERSVATSPSEAPDRVETALRRLAWLGADLPEGWVQLAERHERARRPDRAISAWRGLMDQLRRTGQLPSAETSSHLATLLLVHQRSQPASLQEATRHARFATRAAPDDPAAHEVLARVLSAAGRPSEALEAARRALDLSHARGDSARSARLRQLVRLAEANAAASPRAGPR